ncbi:MAG: glycoside hydrolase family 16 protein [Pseudonocardiaceae bacterium]
MNSAPNPHKWVHDVGGGWGKHELEYYTDSPRNSFQDGQGHLVIVARKERAEDRYCWQKPCEYTSGRLKTQGKFTQQYGYFEARIQVPHGQGIWPAFWMLGDNIDSVGCPACGEIDVMESLGSEPDTVYGSAHGPPDGPGSQVNSYRLGGGRLLSNEFHTFGVEWAPDSVSWYIDGKKYATYTKTQAAPKSWVYDRPFFLLLNVAVGGEWPGNPDSFTKFPQTMLVDYVRAYQRAS